MFASSLESILGSWSFDPSILIVTTTAALIYISGWRRLRRDHRSRFGLPQLAAFLGGLACGVVAICSPLDAFGGMLLWVHMTQHVLLLMVVAPLILIARPAGPLLRGLPMPVLQGVVGPALANRRIRAVGRCLSTPVIALSIFILATWIWHVPALYEVALIDPFWHRFEHVTFLAASIIFWFPVIRPWPASPTGPQWMIVPYLLIADLQNTLLAAIFCFVDRVLYPTYQTTAGLLGWSPLDDQALAGVIMWVPGSIIFLVPLGIILARLLTPPMVRPAVIGGAASTPALAGGALPVLGGPTTSPTRPSGQRTRDLLRTPALGRIVASATSRRIAQVTLLVIAGLIVADGLLGPQATSMNLAGVVPWTHGRGLVVIALLLVGNLFCGICPLTLPRSMLGRLAPSARSVPRWLTTKWTVVALIAIYLWAYEAFALWASPWLTAWIIVGYFATSLFVDLLFPAGTFCRHLCPIGHFNSVVSLLSPTQVSVRDPGVCVTCTSKACLAGSETAPGCPSHLLQPRKHGNLDCTSCLKCVRACPHDNIGVLPQSRGGELAVDRARSSVGRFTTRPDVAALITLLSVGGLANAAGMTGPVLSLQDQLVETLHLHRQTVIAVMAGVSLIILPVIVISAAALISTALARLDRRHVMPVACRFSMTLLPLGAAMWACHMLFHLLTSWRTIVPVAQRAAGDVGIHLGEPSWLMSCCGPMPLWLIPLELAILGVGLVMSVWLAGRVGHDLSATRRGWGRMALPWVVVHVTFWVGAVWVVLQPMQMRGTLLP